jgi:hypothetical protein
MRSGAIAAKNGVLNTNVKKFPSALTACLPRFVKAAD